MPALEMWERKNYKPGGGDAFVHYAMFGSFGQQLNLNAAQYRSAGVPPGGKVQLYERHLHPEIFQALVSGYLGETLNEQPELARGVRNAPGCLILQGDFPDPLNLNYLRDLVGIATALLDNGAAVLFDSLTFRWWSPQQWRMEIFEPNAPVPRHHVVIYVSEEQQQSSDMTPSYWVHTRGMRKFGRPDISVHGVHPSALNVITDLCNRFIEMLALGEVVPPGQPIKMPGLPEGLHCYLEGSYDDPDFNNLHLEIR